MHNRVFQTQLVNFVSSAPILLKNINNNNSNYNNNNDNDNSKILIVIVVIIITIIIIRKKKEIKKNFPYEESFEIMEEK